MYLALAASPLQGFLQSSNPPAGLALWALLQDLQGPLPKRQLQLIPIMPEGLRSEPVGSLLSGAILAIDAYVGPKSLKDSQMKFVLGAQLIRNETCLKTDDAGAPLIPHR